MKNHWKKLHKKLNEKNFPKTLTCFLMQRSSMELKTENSRLISIKMKRKDSSTWLAWLLEVYESC